MSTGKQIAFTSLCMSDLTHHAIELNNAIAHGRAQQARSDPMSQIGK
jgi:hypothetical protein